MMDLLINTYSPRERLTEAQCLAAKSFIEHGHIYRIFSYRPIENAPPGVVLADANSILKTKKEVSINQFCWEFLAHEGGVWVNPDLVCLQPITVDENVQFVFSNVEEISMAFIKSPRRHAITRMMWRRTRHPIIFSLLHPAAWKLLPSLWRWRARLIRERLGEQLNGEAEMTRIIFRRRDFLDVLPSYYFFPVQGKNCKQLYDKTWGEELQPFKDSFGVYLFTDKCGMPLREVDPDSFIGRLVNQHAPNQHAPQT